MQTDSRKLSSRSFRALATGLGLLLLGGIFTAGWYIAHISRNAEKPLPQGIEAIRESGELVVLTVQSPTTFFHKGERLSGYEVELTKAVADALGVDVRYRLYDDVPELIKALDEGHGHIAAPGLTQREFRLTNASDEPLVYGPAYKNVRPKALCHRDGRHPESLADTDGLSIGVVAGSGIEETLQNMGAELPALTWEAQDVSSGLVLAERVDKGDLDCAIVDSNIMALALRTYPPLINSFTLGTQDRQIAWGIAPQSTDLNAFLKPWFQDAHQDGFLHDLDERYYGHFEEFDFVDISVFRKRIKTRLPDFETSFRAAAEAYNLDWTMLAAQGYQESHWDPKAKSPTGVRGLMMLTRPTAMEVGVENRLNPTESIEGGAIYMSRIFDRLPDEVTGYDRLWMAMAAYNIGYGHLSDARRLADRQGLDKNKWYVIDDMLPLLTLKKYYSTVRHGYARGNEPVRYVRRIREYDHVLTKNVPRPEQPPFVVSDDAAQTNNPTSPGEP